MTLVIVMKFFAKIKHLMFYIYIHRKLSVTTALTLTILKWFNSYLGFGCCFLGSFLLLLLFFREMGSRENSPFFVFYHREHHLIINMIIKILKFTWRKKTSLNITALTRLPGSTWALTSYNGYCDRAWWNYDTSLQTFSSRVIILSPNFLQDLYL